jgi:hypothetical protein
MRRGAELGVSLWLGRPLARVLSLNWRQILELKCRFRVPATVSPPLLPRPLRLSGRADDSAKSHLPLLPLLLLPLLLLIAGPTYAAEPEQPPRFYKFGYPAAPTPAWPLPGQPHDGRRQARCVGAAMVLRQSGAQPCRYHQRLHGKKIGEEFVHSAQGSKKIVETARGTFEFSSNPETGTNVRMTLPIATFCGLAA